MTHHRNHGAVAIDSNQFEPIAFGGFRDNARRHDGWFGIAIPEVAQSKAVADFMQDDVTLQLRGKRGKIVRVNTNETRAIRERGGPGHALRVNVLGGLVELCLYRYGEPHGP